MTGAGHDNDAVRELDAAAHRRLAVALFNHVWTLLAKADRTSAEVDEMIHAAHASRHHWSKAAAAAGDRDEAAAWRDRARAALAGVADPEDCAVIEADLARLPI